MYLWLARHLLMRIFDVTILDGTPALPTTYPFTGNRQIYAGGDPNSFAQLYNQAVEPLVSHLCSPWSHSDVISSHSCHMIDYALHTRSQGVISRRC